MPSPTADIFATVAAETRTAYERAGHRLACFADIATEVLARVNPAALDKRALLELALARLNARANRACFHDATNVVPVYADDQFIMTFHMWTDTFGNAHSHRWSGAFQNLSDPVVYVDYGFELGERYDNDLHFGAREQLELSLLERGAVVRVEQDRSIHGFGHTGSPGLTLAVRARSVGGQTLDYWGPGLRLTTTPDDEVAHNVALIGRTLRRLRIHDEQGYRAGLERTLAANGLRACVVLGLDLVSTRPSEAGELADAILTAHDCGPSHTRAIRAALEARAFHQQALGLLEVCDTPRSRLLAALLRFCEDRRQLDRVVAGLDPAAFDLDPAALGERYTELLVRAGTGSLPTGAAGRALARVLVLLIDGRTHAEITADLQSRFHLPEPERSVAAMVATVRDLALTRQLLPCDPP
ncbi:hypothetical protein [Enhygromyxa salina]|uniref:Uncharacterized protein n=1 Tax=Enhygromyxa salina TaxID=215803 RepID=A0A2S9YPE9_9BACT|nr:hypothetical protein [Enhygromyxa salina]PRQ06952.1 hypothetical protein ENSA7_33760 [Enhygromyxa salina]